MSDNKLNVIDLHKRYGEHEVLKGVSLRAQAGDVISIIGSSGSGKSTFLRCINFLEKPSEGTIVVNGQNIGLVRDKDGQLKVADKNQAASAAYAPDDGVPAFQPVEPYDGAGKRHGSADSGSRAE
ncbi:Histidine transport ATP-binding protein HisP [Raoultella planticola]|uniref:Histidine transport ATP-binding protein HisP n=1 Tax=Raoultella planticola TaxID=575 RepID=A0A485C3Q5_RAOPL|nr:Histidine transport ATP-binding protein HisP [Raoultella planticola]